MNKFEEVIQVYLNNQAEKDPHLAERMKLESKNITDCCEYIISEVEKTDRQGFADEEIYAMARHYYLEDNLEIKEVVGRVRRVSRVVVNHAIRETVQDKKPISKKDKPEVKNYEQVSLFDISI
jgi:hypothetical protein